MGKTYKDSREHSRENSRNFRQMPNNVKNKIPIGRCISGKVGFPNEALAQTRAGEILAGDNPQDVKFFRVYYCELCKHYHLTSQEFR
jgi:hypothetical protein